MAVKLRQAKAGPQAVDAAALLESGRSAAAAGNWPLARRCFVAAVALRPGLGLARSSAALAAFQLGHDGQAEVELRALVRRYPLLAEAHAALAALLCSRGAIEEARNCWSAANRLDPRCRQRRWLLENRHWPPLPVAALEPLFAPAC